MDNQQTTDGQPTDNQYYTREEFDRLLKIDWFERLPEKFERLRVKKKKLSDNLQYSYFKRCTEDGTFKGFCMTSVRMAQKTKSFKAACVIYRPLMLYRCNVGQRFTGIIRGLEPVYTSFDDNQPHYKPTKEEFQRFLSMPIPERAPYACANCGAKMEYNKKTGNYEHI